MTTDTAPTVVPVALGRKPASLPATHGPELLPLDAGEQYRFGFSMDACIGCHSCEVACAEQNGLPAGTAWRRVGELESGDHPSTRRLHISMSCNHCLEPACLAGCPTNAYEKLANGVVAHHADDCIGCQYCTWTCPYSVPALQPDRRIVTKCDLCQPRLSEGLAPACVGACPTHAITVEKVDVAAWRADHAKADAPGLPPSDLTLSTTRIESRVPVAPDARAASDWSVRPEDPHWPLVWLTLLSQIAVGVSVTGSGAIARVAAAALAVAALAGATVHLGRPAVAWKAVRNLRRSWLSREVVLLGAYAALALVTVVAPLPALPTGAVGLAGVYASARLYLVPGRPAWDTRVTVVRFFATAAALGGAATGHLDIAAAGGLVALGATAWNWSRLARAGSRAARASVDLELRRLRAWTITRWITTVAGVLVALAGGPASLALVLLGCGEAVGRWLFYVTVVPLDVPGAFWHGAHEDVG